MRAYCTPAPIVVNWPKGLLCDGHNKHVDARQERSHEAPTHCRRTIKSLLGGRDDAGHAATIVDCNDKVCVTNYVDSLPQRSRPVKALAYPRSTAASSTSSSELSDRTDMPKAALISSWRQAAETYEDFVRCEANGTSSSTSASRAARNRCCRGAG